METHDRRMKNKLHDYNLVLTLGMTCSVSELIPSLGLNPKLHPSTLNNGGAASCIQLSRFLNVVLIHLFLFFEQLLFR